MHMISEGELKIYYCPKLGVIDLEFEAKIEKVLKKYGYKRWASGMHLESGIRDIAFDKKK